MLLHSCTANPRVTDPQSLTPSDFSLDISVVTAERHTLAHMRSSRYVIFPDGALHHGDEEGWGPNTLPPRTRLLSRAQVATVWGRLDQMGMSTPKRADETVNFQLLPRPEAGSAYMVGVQANGKYWNFVRYIDSDDVADPAFQNLIRLLGRYAWATDQPATDSYIEPIRYDVGVNPYDRYRTNE